MFQVLLIVISFVIAWGEAWFLDCRVIPQEQHAQSYLNAISSTFDDRGPLLAPFLATSTGTGRRTESIANFYSPYESIHNSDDEEDKVRSNLHEIFIDQIDIFNQSPIA